MRDPKRIPTVLAALGTFWSRYPDVRLGQLLGNFEIGYNTEDEVVLAALNGTNRWLEAVAPTEPAESFEDKVERIAAAWFQDIGPDNDFTALDWFEAHPGDKDFARYMVRFILAQAGIVE